MENCNQTLGLNLSKQVAEYIPTEDDIVRSMADQVTPAFGPAFGIDAGLTLPALESSTVTSAARAKLATKLHDYIARRYAENSEPTPSDNR